MNSIYAKALRGELRSPADATAIVNLSIYNKLPITIAIYTIDTGGRRVFLGLIPPDQPPKSFLDLTYGSYFMATLSGGGAFICSYEMIPNEPNNTFYCEIDYNSLSEPNDIGPIPQPTKEIPVPQASPMVLVGCGPTQNGGLNWIIREQFWNLLGDSYSLAPGESHTTSYTIVSGRQSTSSSQEDMSAAVGVSSTAGWGPISLSLSASLNASASFFQQVTVTEQSTTYISDTATNNSESPLLMLRWQLTDVISVLNSGGVPVATVASGSVVIVQSYDLSLLASQVARPPAERRVLPSSLSALAN